MRKHWTPRYVVDRVAAYVFQKLNPDAPWLTPQAISILDSWLQPCDVGLEWGAGRSTLWIGKRVARLDSVECDPRWHKYVSERAPPSVTCHFFPYFPGEDPSQPYVRFADSFADQSLDFVLVDGIGRAHCAAVALRKLKPGGLLIIDNANWFIPHETRSPTTPQESPTWNGIIAVLSRWRCIWTSNGVNDTGFWVKP